MTKNSAVAKRQPKQVEPLNNASSIMSVIERVSLTKDADIDKMERLLKLHQAVLDQQAQADFTAAMAAAQAEMLPVARDASNDHTRSTYATMEAISKAITPILAKHGFAMSFGTLDSKGDRFICVTCTLSHIGGHSKTESLNVPIDDAGANGTKNKSATHALGSSIAYGRRYLKMMMVDIATEDDDGQAACAVAKITDAQVKELRELAQKVGADIIKFCRFGNVGALADIDAQNFENAKAQLLRYKGKAG